MRAKAAAAVRPAERNAGGRLGFFACGPWNAGPWDVVHIITCLDLGGAQLATLCEVARSGFGGGQRHLIFGPGGMLDADARKLRGVSLHPVATLRREISCRDWRAWWEIRAIIRRLRRPGARLLVHTHSSKAGVLGRLAAFCADADLVVHTAHGFGHSHHGPRLWRRFLLVGERLAGRVTHGVTADSAANVRQGIREGLFGQAAVQVVHCGVDVDAFARPRVSPAVTRRVLGLAPNDVVVLSLACLKAQKAPEDVVRLARVALEQRRDLAFLLVGDGELRGGVERLARQLGLGDRLRLLGWRRDVVDLLHAADLLLLTSRWEGLPQALGQALAAGLPIVATRVDGVPEAVLGEYNGLLCRVGDLAGLARAVCRLAGDAGLRKRMGDAGRHMAQRFSERDMLRRLDAFYARLVAERS